MVVSERAVAVERTLNFVAKFASSFEADGYAEVEETNPFVVYLFKFLLEVCMHVFLFFTCLGSPGQ